MKRKKISHNKIKNTGILFEMLVRQLTVDTLSGKETSPASSILKKYFNMSTELGKELQLYQSFFNTQRLTESRAIQFLELVLSQRKRLNEQKLLREKYDLIKSIKENYDLKEFFSANIDAYKLHASIYKTFLTESSDEKTSIKNIQEVASARFTLIEHLLGTTKKKSIIQNESVELFKSQAEDLRLLTYKILIDKFNNKYKNLSEPQKQLLREYINNVSNKNNITAYIKTEVPILIESLQQKIKKSTDKVLQIKLNEVISNLSKISNKTQIKDNEVTALIIAHQINNELENGLEKIN